MNKKTLLSFLLAVCLVFPFIVYGQASGTATLSMVVGNVARALGNISIGLATIAFIVAGIMYITATGNPSRMALGKGALVAGVIGVVILIISTQACNIIQGIFGVGSCLT